MPQLNLKDLGRLLIEKRGSTGVRATANEIGVSSATLSRIENGHMPDLETFRRVCSWLDISSDEILGLEKDEQLPRVIFKSIRERREETIIAMSNLIIRTADYLESDEYDYDWETEE